MISFFTSEPELALGLGAVIILWALAIAADINRRLRDRKRRTTSPFRQWALTTGLLWLLCGLTIWAWMASGRSLAELGFNTGAGWSLLAAWGMTAAFLVFQLVQLRDIYRSRETREEIRTYIFDSGDYDQLMPRRRKDSWGFFGVAVTAGIAEEVIFRGFLISVLALIMPLWPAAGLALALFVLGHAYQGVRGLVRILPVSTLLTLVYVLSGSLWPGIALHIAVDVISGLMVWRVLPETGYVEVDGGGETGPAPA